MSKMSWLAEFYPIDANAEALRTNLQRVRHSLQKWRGLRKEALKKHNIVVRDAGGALYTKRTDNFVLEIDSRSCALCVKHYNDWRMRTCASCPLARTRAGHPCDTTKKGENESPWRAWVQEQNPEPMIAALEKAEAALLREQARRKK